jgi:hypothetical protein
MLKKIVVPILALTLMAAPMAMLPMPSRAQGPTIVIQGGGGWHHHPEISAALRALHKAEWHLNHAAHDFGGHRVDAIAAIDAAINQLQICEQYDR